MLHRYWEGGIDNKTVKSRAREGSNDCVTLQIRKAVCFSMQKGYVITYSSMGLGKHTSKSYLKRGVPNRTNELFVQGVKFWGYDCKVPL